MILFGIVHCWKRGRPLSSEAPDPEEVPLWKLWVVQKTSSFWLKIGHKGREVKSADVKAALPRALSGRSGHVIRYTSRDKNDTSSCIPSYIDCWLRMTNFIHSEATSQYFVSYNLYSRNIGKSFHNIIVPLCWSFSLWNLNQYQSSEFMLCMCVCEWMAFVAGVSWMVIVR